MNGYDWIVLAYPLPFLELSLQSKAKELKIFKFYGATGILETYALKRDKYLYLKGKRTDYSGNFTIENPLIEYRVTFDNGMLDKVDYSVRSNPAIYGISQLRSRYLIQSQLIDNLSDECLRISQALIRQVTRYRKTTSSPYLINTLKEMMTLKTKDMRDLPNARYVTLYDMVLLTKAVGAKINIVVDPLWDEKEEGKEFDDLFNEVEEKKEETEILRKNFTQVMKHLEDFYATFDLIKQQPDFTIDSRMGEMLVNLFDKIAKYVLDYRNASRRLPLANIEGHVQEEQTD